MFNNLYLLQWALNILKKPIVTIQWLHQCWNEHRIVPQESYRVLPFYGLAICVTRIPAGCDISYIYSCCLLQTISLCDASLLVFLRGAEGDREAYHTKWWKIFCGTDQEVHTFDLWYILFLGSFRGMHWYWIAWTFVSISLTLYIFYW